MNDELEAHTEPQPITLHAIMAETYIPSLIYLTGCAFLDLVLVIIGMVFLFIHIKFRLTNTSCIKAASARIQNFAMAFSYIAFNIVVTYWGFMDSPLTDFNVVVWLLMIVLYLLIYIFAMSQDYDAVYTTAETYQNTLNKIQNRTDKNDDDN
jgi:quinol-cytochrome oxidoreductase complex cytochrome b subunit